MTNGSADGEEELLKKTFSELPIISDIHMYMDNMQQYLNVTER